MRGRRSLGFLGFLGLMALRGFEDPLYFSFAFFFAFFAYFFLPENDSSD